MAMPLLLVARPLGPPGVGLETCAISQAKHQRTSFFRPGLEASKALLARRGLSTEKCLKTIHLKSRFLHGVRERLLLERLQVMQVAF